MTSSYKQVVDIRFGFCCSSRNANAFFRIAIIWKKGLGNFNVQNYCERKIEDLINERTGNGLKNECCYLELRYEFYTDFFRKMAGEKLGERFFMCVERNEGIR